MAGRVEDYLGRYENVQPATWAMTSYEITISRDGATVQVIGTNHDRTTYTETMADWQFEQKIHDIWESLKNAKYWKFTPLNRENKLEELQKWLVT